MSRMEWHSNDGMEQGKKSEQILIASIPVHPVILEPSWDDSRMTEWLGLGFKPIEFLHPCPSRHPQSSDEWLRQEKMTKNDEKFRSKAVALDFFPPLHPVILVSFHCHLTLKKRIRCWLYIEPALDSFFQKIKLCHSIVIPIIPVSFHWHLTLKKRIRCWLYIEPALDSFFKR